MYSFGWGIQYKYDTVSIVFTFIFTLFFVYCHLFNWVNVRFNVEGEYGQLGHNSTDNLDVPRKIALNDNIVQVSDQFPSFTFLKP